MAFICYRKAMRLSFLLTAAALLSSCHTIEELAPLPGGQVTKAYSINRNGVVAGSSENGSRTVRAVIWRGTAPVLLPTTGGSTQIDEAFAINSADDVGGRMGAAEDWEHAWIARRAGAVTDISGGATSEVDAINEDGLAAGVWRSLAAPTVYNAVRWNADGTRIDLGTLGGNNSHAWGMEKHGQVVGASKLTPEPSPFHAFFWFDGSMRDINGTAFSSVAFAIAADRWPDPSGAYTWIVGDFQRESGVPEHAFLFHNGTMTDLGTLPGHVSSHAWAINSQHTIVGDCGNDLRVFRACMWVGGRVMDLNDTLPSGSGWVLETARGINSRGQIVGWGTHNGQQRAYRMTPSR